jgi:hypothetical protein
MIKFYLLNCAIKRICFSNLYLYITFQQVDLDSIVALNPHVAAKNVVQNNILDKVNYANSNISNTNNLSPAPINPRATVISEMRPPEVIIYLRWFEMNMIEWMDN